MLINVGNYCFSCHRTRSQAAQKGLCTFNSKFYGRLFQNEIKSHVRPPLERCRRFLTQFKIEEKFAKQVQDKIFALGKSL